MKTKSKYLNIFKVQSASSYLEGAIAIPIALICIIAFLYFSLALIAMGILDHAANRTMRTIISHPAFGVDPSLSCSGNNNPGDEPCPDFNQKRQQALLEMYEKARNIPLQTFYGLGQASGKLIYLSNSGENPQITLPEIGNGADKTYYDAIKNQPVVVTLEGRIKSPVPWFSDIKITSTATGYVEIRTKPNLPVRTDCNGYREGHPDYRNKPCDCSSVNNSVWNKETYSCEVCRYDRKAPPGQGTPIPSGYTKNAEESFFRNGRSCLCPTHEKCRELYGQGVYSANVIGDRPDNVICRCACNYVLGFDVPEHFKNETQITPGQGCHCGLAPFNEDDKTSNPAGTFLFPTQSFRNTFAASHGAYSNTTLGSVEVLQSKAIVPLNPPPNVAQTCRCSVFVSPTSSRLLGSSDCNNIFANTFLAGLVQIHSSGCSCTCKWQCPDNAVEMTNYYGLETPNACKCQCKTASRSYDRVTNTCNCTAASTCPAGVPRNEACECSCDSLPSCGRGAIRNKALPGCPCEGCPLPEGIDTSHPFKICNKDPNSVGG